MPQYTKSVLDEMTPERLEVGWPWRLLTISIIVMVMAIVTYLGLIWGYGPFLVSQIGKLDEQLNNLGQQITEGDRAAFLGFYSQFANLKELLSQRVAVSRIFPVLEQNTHQKVYYTSLSTETKDNRLVLEGFADSYDALAKQAAAFEQLNEVARVTFNESQLVEKKAHFKMILFFMPRFFQ